MEPPGQDVEELFEGQRRWLREQLEAVEERRKRDLEALESLASEWERTVPRKTELSEIIKSLYDERKKLSDKVSADDMRVTDVEFAFECMLLVLISVVKTIDPKASYAVLEMSVAYLEYMVNLPELPIDSFKQRFALSEKLRQEFKRIINEMAVEGKQ